MKDANPAMRIQAIRASERLYKAGDRSLAGDYRDATKDADTDVVIQAMLTLNLFKVPDLNTVIQAAQAANKARGVQEIGQRILQPAPSLTFGGGGWLVTPSDVAKVRAATAGPKTPWTLEELDASLPRALVPDATWKITASHNATDAARGVNYAGWTTNSGLIGRSGDRAKWRT